MLAPRPFYEWSNDVYDSEGNIERFGDAWIAVSTERLSIGARYDFEENIFLILNPERYEKLWEAKKRGAVVDIKDKNATIQLEILLLEDCISRQERSQERPPFDECKKEAEPRVIKAILNNTLDKFTLGEEFGYLLELAEKARLEANKTQTE